MKRRGYIRSKRQARKWSQKLKNYRTIQKQIMQEAEDILNSRNFYKTKQYLQHGNVTVNEHVWNVARYSVIISEKLRIPCNRREMIRGALLHDYFLYDWHQPDEKNPHKLHGFYHPGTALRNASRDFDLTDREKDIIKKHMWPLTLFPPLCREGWIVTAADKWCSTMETLHVHRGHGIVQHGSRKERN